MIATRPSVTGAYVGASGFSFGSWTGGFYPPDAKPADFLAFYAGRLPTVELNNTFYRLPAEQTFRNWADTVPEGFRFAVKTPMAITHFGRLDQIGAFAERVQVMGGKLGPLLVRLQDQRPRDDGFVELLLGSLGAELRVALDLRDPSWDGVEAGLPVNAVRVNDLDAAAPFRYLRLREPPYDDSALSSWADRLRPLLGGGVEVYCYFRHEDEPTAPRYARRLLELLAP